MTLASSSIGEGPALVLLHAFPLDRSLYRDVTASLAEEGWQVITPDLPGFGESRDPVSSIDDMAGRVAQLLDVLNINSAVIGGCSMGGYVALSFAAQFPQRTAGLVLIDTKADADASEEVRDNRERIASQVEASGSTEALARNLPESMLAPSTRDALSEWLISTARAQSQHGVAAAQRAMAARSSQLDTLAGLLVPVLCIRGADDTVSSAADHQRMADAARDAVSVTIEGAGHLVPIEQPVAFAQHVAAFLTSIRRPAC